MADTTSGFYARNRRRIKRRRELSDATVGDKSGDDTRASHHPVTDPKTNPVTASNTAWNTMKPPPGY